VPTRKIVAPAARPSGERFNLKSSPLLMAVELDDVDCVKLALRNGEAVDIRDLDGNTPLIRAAFLGNAAMVRVFIESGADVNAANDLGWTGLHFVAQENRHAVAQLLLEAPGVNVNALDNQGNNPLFRAVFSEAIETMRLLLRAGADLECKNRHGVSPAGLAESTGLPLPR
jgi:ankyrin repeat protein